MEYKENALSYEDYCRLRESVSWRLFSKEQMQEALSRSLYTITAVEDDQTVGMGRLVGDGMYYLMADLVVHPAYQKRGVGTEIADRLMKYVEDRTPAGGRSSLQLIAEKGKEGFYEKVIRRAPVSLS